MGFCRTNLFKRLESGGQAFVQSIERHILRNHIFLHAIKEGKPLPLGTQDAEMLDARLYDRDAEDVSVLGNIFENDEGEKDAGAEFKNLCSEDDFEKCAEKVYELYSTKFKTRFKWLRPGLFGKTLEQDLKSDARSLLSVLKKCRDWDPNKDAKLNALAQLLTKTHPTEKALVFTQFADTVLYLESELKKRGINRLAGVTGDSPDPTGLAWWFSPKSNEKEDIIKPEDELRVLITTDVLSEGQNLQDCAVIVNYDLPWAIIRLVQRAGRVDRIGQNSERILCYSFLPADGVERIIRLRARVRQRLRTNAEVIGTDEAFFEDDRNDDVLLDLYNEKAGILDGDEETEVDLASYAYQIWKNAITADPKLQKAIPELPAVVYSTREHSPTDQQPEGALVYLRTASDNDALAWMDKSGASVTESQYAILKAAECKPGTPALPRQEKHHELVQKGVELIVKEERSVGGQLGNARGARFRAYERLKRYSEEIKGMLFDTEDLRKAIDEIYRYPLRESAKDSLNRQLNSGITDEKLAELVIALRTDDRLCIITEEGKAHEPQIICSMGLSAKNIEGNSNA